MPALKNPKHEKFAQGLAQGLSQLEAYSSAGYNPHAPNACSLAAKPSIVERVAELQNKIVEIKERALERATQTIVDRYAISETRILDELARMAFANMLDYIRVTPEGQPYIDFSAVDRDKGVAIQQITCEITTVMEVDSEGERVPVQVRKASFRLADKQKALLELGKNLGLFQQKVEHKILQDTRPAAEQRAELLEELAALGIHIVPPAEEEPQGVANRTAH
jgi:phage terminase small subunit